MKSLQVFSMMENQVWFIMYRVPEFLKGMSWSIVPYVGLYWNLVGIAKVAWDRYDEFINGVSSQCWHPSRLTNFFIDRDTRMRAGQAPSIEQCCGAVRFWPKRHRIQRVHLLLGSFRCRCPIAWPEARPRAIFLEVWFWSDFQAWMHQYHCRTDWLWEG